MFFDLYKCSTNVSTHSHPKVAADEGFNIKYWDNVSTHSHPKVAAPKRLARRQIARAFQHTATRRWLRRLRVIFEPSAKFQHTATRRWLPTRSARKLSMVEVSTHSHPKVAAINTNIVAGRIIVSTHSHPKVAAGIGANIKRMIRRFNTQPPEGGCSLHKKARRISALNTVFR